MKTYKLILSLFIVMLLSISLVSATQFDNWKTYDNDLEEVTIKNWFNIGETLLKAQRLTPQNVELIPLPTEELQKVAEVDVETLITRFGVEEAFTDMKFYDMNNDMKEIPRKYEWRYKKQVGTKQEKEFGIVETYYDKEGVRHDVSDVIGYNEVPIYEWFAFKSLEELPSKDLVIGLFVDAEKGDNIEWIPELYGKRIDEWAAWSDVSEDAVACWKFNENSGTNAKEEFNGVYNLTVDGSGWITANVKNGSAWDTDGSDGIYSGFALDDLGSDEITLVIWFKRMAAWVDNDQHYATQRGGSWTNGDLQAIVYNSNSLNRFLTYDSVGGKEYQTWKHADATEFHLMTVIVNSSNMKTYWNDTLENDVALTGWAANSKAFHFFEDEAAGDDMDNTAYDEIIIFNRSLDATDVANLWNTGTGVFCSGVAPDVSPTVNLGDPANNSMFNVTTIDINCNATDTDGGVVSLDLIISGAIDTSITNTTANQNLSINISKTLVEDMYNWTCNATDSQGLSTQPEERIFEVHLTPPTITILSPNTTIESIAPGNNISLSWAIEEAGENLTEHITNCSYIYNGIETELANPSICLVANQTNFTYVDNIDSISFKVVDEFGFTTIATRAWDILIKENSQTYSTPVVEGTLQDFVANVTIEASIEISSATLIYNNTFSQVGTITSSGQERILEVANYMIPDTGGNVTFYWSLVLTDSSVVNLTTQIQEVFALNLDDCSAHSNQLFNISLYDEETQNPLNGTIELFYQVQNKPNYNVINNLSASYIGVFGTLVCSDINLTGENLAYSAEIRYYSDDYATELYHIQKADIEDVVVISLYDLQLNDTTEFTINYENEDVVKITDAIIQLQRKYISENIYRTIEAPLTGEGGKAVVHVDLNTNKYRAVVVKDGIVLDVFENIVFECENELSGQCEQNLFAPINSQNSIEVTQLNDFAYSISETNGTVTTVFSIPSGTPGVVNIQLSQVDQFGNETLCNQTIISSSGSIDCTYSTTIGESYLKLQILKDGYPQAYKTYIIPEAGALDFLGNNFFIVFIFLLSIIGMAFTSPEWIVINSVITMLIAGSLWLLNGLNFVVGLGGLMWLIVAAIILIMKISKQEDR